MNKYKWQFLKPKDKECEKHAKAQEVKWKHKGGSCPYCILLDKEYDSRSLKVCMYEAWRSADRALGAFFMSLDPE